MEVSIWFLIAVFFFNFYMGIKMSKATFVYMMFKIGFYVISGFCVYYLYTGSF